MESCGQDSDCAAYGTAWGCREQSLEDGKEDEDRGKRFVCSKR